MSPLPFLERLSRGEVLVADGATGTNLQQRGLAAGTAPEVWVLEQPEKILQLHRDFVAAGSDLILTATFGGTPLRLQHSGLLERTAEVNRRAAALAREATAGAQVLVAGSLGPVGALIEPYGPLSEADVAAAYADQARALAEAGVDVLVVETQFDLSEATCAIKAVRATTTLPLVCSFSFDTGTRTMMGLTPAKVAQALDELGVDVVGLNCGKSLEHNLANLREMCAVTQRPVWMKPNAGLPRLDEAGVAVYDVSPEQMGQAAQTWVAAGATVVGGCCGTSPAHLRAMAEAVKVHS